MISHRNVIANVLQIATYEKPMRDLRKGNKAEVALGLLPLSHIYGLVVIAQASTWRGDETIILPKFEFQSYLRAIETYKIEGLYLVSILPCVEDLSNMLRYLRSSFKWPRIKQHA